MDESNQNAAISTSNREHSIHENHLDLIRESYASSENTISDDESQEERMNSTLASAADASQSGGDILFCNEREFSLRINDTSKRKDFSYASDIINQDRSSLKKKKSSYTLLHGSRRPTNISDQDNGMNKNLESQGYKSNKKANMSSSHMTGDVLLKDEDKLRRERKRLANRESAKRSRMRKWKEREELKATVDALNIEVSILTKQLRTLSEDCVELNDEIDSLMEELEEKYGLKAVSDLKAAKGKISVGSYF